MQEKKFSTFAAGFVLLYALSRRGGPDSYREVDTPVFAGVVELVDTLVSGTSAARLGSSSLPTCTDYSPSKRWAFFVVQGRREVYAAFWR